MEEVFAKYEDTAGNLHWHGTETGEHIIKKQDPHYAVAICTDSLNTEGSVYYENYYDDEYIINDCKSKGLTVKQIFVIEKTIS